MNFKSFFILLISFYFLVLLQYSFFFSFNVKGIIPNFVLISICLFNFFEKTEKRKGIWAAFFAGFFLDIFSGFFLGTSIIILLIVSIIFKKAHHILKESQEKFPFCYFLPLFFLSFILYYFLMKISITFSYDFPLQFNLILFSVTLIYNLVLGVILFYLLKLFFFILNKL